MKSIIFDQRYPKCGLGMSKMIDIFVQKFSMSTVGCPTF